MSGKNWEVHLWALVLFFSPTTATVLAQEFLEWEVVPNRDLTFNSMSGSADITGFFPLSVAAGLTEIKTIYRTVQISGEDTTINDEFGDRQVFNGSLTFDVGGGGTSNVEVENFVIFPPNCSSFLSHTEDYSNLQAVDNANTNAWAFTTGISRYDIINETSAEGKFSEDVSCGSPEERNNNASASITLSNPVNVAQYAVPLDTVSVVPRTAHYNSFALSTSFYNSGDQVDVQVSRSNIAFTATLDVSCSGEYEIRYIVDERMGSESATPEEKVIDFPGTYTIVPSIHREFEISCEIHAEPGKWSTLKRVEYRLISSDCGGIDCSSRAMANLGSIDWRLPLNPISSATSGGELILTSDTMDSTPFGPEDLQFQNPEPSAIEVIYREGSTILRQILTSAYLIDILTEAEDGTIPSDGFEVRLYSVSAAGTFDEQTGFYPVTGTAHLRYVFEDPNLSLPALQIQEYFEGGGSPVITNLYSYDASMNSWTLDAGEKVVTETVSSVTLANLGCTSISAEKREVKVVDSLDRIQSLEASYYMDFNYPDGSGTQTIPLLKQRTEYTAVDSGGVGIESTANITYFQFYGEETANTSDPRYADPSDPKFGKLRKMERSDGYWEYYEYDSNGRISKTVSQYLDNSFSEPVAAIESSNRVVETHYTDFTSGAEGNLHVSRTESLLGWVISLTWEMETTVGSNRQLKRIRAPQPGNSWDDPGNFVTVQVIDEEGRLLERLDEQGILTLTQYSAPNSVGETTMTQKVGAPNVVRDDVVDGTLTVTVENRYGYAIREEITDIASGIELSYMEVPPAEVDFAGRPTLRLFDDGTTWSGFFGCCGLSSETNREGTTTTYNYDSLGRETYRFAAGIAYETNYDAYGTDGPKIIRKRIGIDSSEMTLIEEEYDLAGRLIKVTDAVGNDTEYPAETFPSSGVVQTKTIYADLSESIETGYSDGKPKEISGTATYPVKYEYGVVSETHDGLTFNARTTKEIFVEDVGGVSGADEYRTTYTDMLGRVYKVEYPALEGSGTTYELRFYNDKNQLVRTEDPDGVTMLYVYDNEGELIEQVVDTDQDDTVDYNETDRITRTVTTVLNDPIRGDVIRATTAVHTTDNNDTSTDEVSVIDRATDGLNLWQTLYGVTTHTLIEYPGSGLRKETTTTHEGLITVATYEDGQMASRKTTNPAGEVLSDLTYGYDAHDRLATVTDARNGTTSYTYFADDQVETITAPSHDGTAPSQVTTFAYDNRGRERTVTLPDGGEVETRYFATGDIEKQWGARTYPVEYTYDSQGRMETMTTWQVFDQTNGVGLSGSAITQWLYNSRGLLLEKRYNYVDDQSFEPGPIYTYFNSGRLETRTWARGTVTTYGYSDAGDLETLDYSDSTVDVSYTYDRQGRRKTITDASGTRTLGYDSGILTQETYSSSPFLSLVDRSVVRSLDSYNRFSGISINAGSGNIHTATYGYSHPDTVSETGRLSTVSVGDFTSEYRYQSNTTLVDTLTHRSSSGAVLTTTKTCDKLNRLTTISSEPLADDTISYTYQYNSANQRTRATLDETGEFWDFSYDPLGQVTGGTKKLSGGTSIPGHEYSYTFDEIGNRLTSNAPKSSSGTSSYNSTNELNQYERRTVPRLVDILGLANPAASVSVNGESASFTGDYFLKTFDYSGEPHPDDARYDLYEVEGTIPGGGEGGTDAIAVDEGEVFLPGNPESFTYDDDGNLLTDGQWSYSWNGENRLVVMETLAEAYTAGVERLKLEFAYDSQGRRFSKKVYEWNSGSSSWDLNSESLFLYDGWNLIWELTTEDTESTEKTFVWGLDLSGTLQGAGGVGGLLWVREKSGIQIIRSFIPAYDGNGNVVALFDQAGALAESYEYGPFGEAIEFRDEEELNPFRFSTKYWDLETDLAYYGYRYYSPDLGRWLNRDPFGNEGGENLYGYLGNGPFQGIEYLGLYNILGLEFRDGGNPFADLWRYGGAYYQGIGIGLGKINNSVVEVVKTPWYLSQSLGTFSGLLIYDRQTLANTTISIFHFGDRLLNDPCLRQTLGSDIKDYISDYENQSQIAASLGVEILATLLTAGLNKSSYLGKIPKYLDYVEDIPSNRIAARTNTELVQEVANRAARQSFEGSARVQGTLSHGYADRLLTRYQRMFGDRGLSTEIRYLDGVPNQGGLGSIRLDVVEGPLGNPTSIFDYKFGTSGLTQPRINQIRGVGNFADDVPIFEVRPTPYP